MFKHTQCVFSNQGIMMQYVFILFLFIGFKCDDLTTRQMYDSMARLHGDLSYPDDWYFVESKHQPSTPLNLINFYLGGRRGMNVLIHSLLLLLTH